MASALAPVGPVATTTVGRKILAAASRLFFEYGITATGVDLIASEAGTTKRTLYQRFGSKEALVAACLQDRAHRWQVELLSGLDGEDCGADLAVIYRQARRWAGESPRGCAFVNAWAELQPLDGPGAAMVRQEKHWMLDLFTHLAADDATLGSTLHLVFEGAQVAASIRQSQEPFSVAEGLSRSLLLPSRER